MANLTVTALFTKNNRQPATGLTLSQIDLYLWSVNKSSGVVATVWNPQNPSAEIGGGSYLKVYASADFETFDYVARAQYTGATALDSNYAYSQASDNPADPWVMPTRTLSAAGVQAIWDALTSALTTAGSIGKLLVDNINATIGSRSSHSATDVWASGTRTLTSFGTLVADIWAYVSRTLTSGGSGPSVQDIVDGILAELLSNAKSFETTIIEIWSNSGGEGANPVEWQYPVTDSTSGRPLEGVEVWFYSDANTTNLIWYGVTDAFGVARDRNRNLPRLDPGTYYVKTQKAGYIPNENVDVEVVTQ